MRIDNLDKNLGVLMNCTPEDLPRLQYEAARKHTITILEEVLELVKEGRYDDIVENYLSSSPAGDGYGTYNEYICFQYDHTSNQGMDISQMMELLSSLRKRSKEA